MAFTFQERFNQDIKNLHSVFGSALDRIADLEEQLEKANIRIQTLQKFNAQLLSTKDLTATLRSMAVEKFIAAVEEIVGNADRNRTVWPDIIKEKPIPGDPSQAKI